MVPEVVARVADELNESNEKTVRVRSVDNQALDKYPGEELKGSV